MPQSKIYIIRIKLIFICLFSSLLCKAQTDAEILNNNITVKVSANQLLKQYEQVIKINNRRGLDYANFSILFSNQIKISDLKVFTTSFDGKILSKLKRKDIFDRSVIHKSSFYTDRMFREFSMYENCYPYIINCTYSTIQKEFYNIIDWIPVLYRDIPIHKSMLKIIHPKNYSILIKESHIEPINKIIDASDVNIIYEATYIPQEKDEYLSPIWLDLLPSVKIVPEIFNYKHEGSFTSWEQYGNWQIKILEDKRELPSEERIRINNLIKKEASELEKARVLYHYLQDEMRYVNVSVDYGGLEPYPASYVAKNRFGDCKALSNYMVTVLKYAGLEAFPVDISSGLNKTFIDEAFPSQQFNHVIVAAIAEKDTLFLECTSSLLPFNYVPHSIQNRLGLMIKKDSSKIIKIPAVSVDSILQIMNYTVKSSLGHSYIVDCDFELRGYSMEKIDAVRGSYSYEDQKDYFDNYFAIDNYKLVNFEIIRKNRDDLFLRVKSKIEVVNMIEEFGASKIINLPVLALPNICSPDERTNDIVIPYSLNVIDTTRIMLAFGEIHEQNMNETIEESQFGKFEIRLNKYDDYIEIIRRLIIFEGRFQVEEYHDFYAFITGIKKRSDRLMIKEKN